MLSAVHIIVVSACSKKAIRRTRAIMDRYALRIAEKVWKTPITKEGLAVLKKKLSSSATKNTAIICLRNFGARDMRPVFSIGNKTKFSNNGSFAVYNTTNHGLLSRTRDFAIEKWVEDAKRVAIISGWLHDLGKNNAFFAQKIKSIKHIADPVRHEWLSLLLLEALYANLDFNTAWEQAISRCDKTFKQQNNNAGFKDDLFKHTFAVNGPLNAIKACIVTHHRLFEESDSQINANCFFRDPVRDSELDRNLFRIRAADFPKQIIKQTVKFIAQIKTMEDTVEHDPTYWRAITILSRATLIMADHFVSSEDYNAKDAHPPFANSKKVNNINVEKQPLSWHLASVGTKAGEYFTKLMELANNLDGLDSFSLDNINTPSMGYFHWQEKAAQAIAYARDTFETKPMLILLNAGTGSGKTRACVRLATLANTFNAVRLTTIFNLRTLTLQTGRDYVDQLGIDPNSLAVVIGDKNTYTAFKESMRDEEFNEDEMDRDLEDGVEVTGWDGHLPDWLAFFLKNKKHLKSMIGAPVFVSTADYIVPAAELYKQGRHIIPLIRVMTSDLILDEIDNYDSKSLPAILRLIEMAGLFGRNVVVSSATLNSTLASAISEYYQNGIAMHDSLRGSADGFVYGLISDITEPVFQPFSTADAFLTAFESGIANISNQLKANEQHPTKKAFIKKFSPSESNFMLGISESVAVLHKQNQWECDITHKALSVGLVRVSTIKTALKVAEYLRESLYEYRPMIVCYHSNLFNAQRVMLEKDMDTILRRNKPQAPAHHPSVRSHLLHSDTQSGMFIVVATPVEEVGRDHDFDWAVIEPSSTQSIVQCAGRVNRHRRAVVVDSNVAILQHNFLFCQKPASTRPVFVRPGNEKDGALYPHNICDLINENSLAVSLDARLRFDTETHLLSKLDDQSLSDILKDPLKRMKHKNLWLSQFTYKGYPLRESNNNAAIVRFNSEKALWEDVHQEKTKVVIRARNALIKRCSKYPDSVWLTPDVDAIISFCEKYNLDKLWGLEVSMLHFTNEYSEIEPQYFQDGFTWL